MRNLIDTLSLIRAINDFSKLGSNASAAMQDRANDPILSSGSIWEILIK
jgi:PIN domain nuclease of toxin-antitoxin system